MKTFFYTFCPVFLLYPSPHTSPVVPINCSQYVGNWILFEAINHLYWYRLARYLMYKSYHMSFRRCWEGGGGLKTSPSSFPTDFCGPTRHVRRKVGVRGCGGGVDTTKKPHATNLLSFQILPRVNGETVQMIWYSVGHQFFFRWNDVAFLNRGSLHKRHKEHRIRVSDREICNSWMLSTH